MFLSIRNALVICIFFWSDDSLSLCKHISPTGSFPILEPRNPSMDVSDLLKVSRSTDSEALVLWNVRSVFFVPCIYFREATTRPTLLQFSSLEICRSKFLNYIKFANRRIFRPQSCERVCRVLLRFLLLGCMRHDYSYARTFHNAGAQETFPLFIEFVGNRLLVSRII